MPPARRPLLSIPPFILRSDGEWSDPYDGIGGEEVGEVVWSSRLLGRIRFKTRGVDSIDYSLGAWLWVGIEYRKSKKICESVVPYNAFQLRRLAATLTQRREATK